MSDDKIANRVFFTMLALFAMSMVILWYVLAQVLIPLKT
jgi:phage shock protein PspC (stress-responsive transcriptional regulator)